MMKKVLAIIILPLLAGFTTKPASENLRATFFFRSITDMSTAYPYVLTTVYSHETKEFEERFLEASDLFSAINTEHDFMTEEPFDDGFKKTVRYALKQQPNGFTFEKPKAQERIVQHFDALQLLRCRESVEQVGIQKVLFYLRGLSSSAFEESLNWFEVNKIDYSPNGPLAQILYENGYYPTDSNGMLSYDDGNEYRKGLGAYILLMIDMGVIDSETSIVEPAGSGQPM